MTTHTEPKIDLTGWELTSECLDPGTYKTPSTFRVTVSFNGGKPYTTEYTQGAYYRQWIKRWPRAFASALPKPEKTLSQLTIPGCKMSTDDLAALETCTEPTPPTLEGVLHALISDAGCVRYGQSFDEFCEDSGYDNDSRKAERAYNACSDTWRGLIAAGADLDRLERLFQDY